MIKFWDVRRVGSSSSTGGRGKKKAAVKAPVPTREISCSTREGSRRGISSLTFRKGGVGGASRLLVNVLSDSLAVIDIGQKQHDARTVLRCTGHQATSFYNRATFSPDGNFIAGASADSVVYLWDARVSTSFDGSLSASRSALGVEQRAPCFALKGHLSEVNGVAWSSHDFTQLASCSDDGTVRCWQVGGERGQRTGPRQRETTAESTKPFELQLAPKSDSSEAATKTEWANWSGFVEQPEGFAYRVRGNESALAPRPSSPRRRRVSTADTQKVHLSARGVAPNRDCTLSTRPLLLSNSHNRNRKTHTKINHSKSGASNYTARSRSSLQHNRSELSEPCWNFGGGKASPTWLLVPCTRN